MLFTPGTPTVKFSKNRDVFKQNIILKVISESGPRNPHKLRSWSYSQSTDLKIISFNFPHSNSTSYAKRDNQTWPQLSFFALGCSIRSDNITSFPAPSWQPVKERRVLGKHKPLRIMRELRGKKLFHHPHLGCKINFLQEQRNATRQSSKMRKLVLDPHCSTQSSDCKCWWLLSCHPLHLAFYLQPNKIRKSNNSVNQSGCQPCRRDPDGVLGAQATNWIKNKTVTMVWCNDGGTERRAGATSGTQETFMWCGRQKVCTSQIMQLENNSDISNFKRQTLQAKAKPI